MIKTKFAVLIACAATIVVAGCSGGGPETTPTPAEPTPTPYGDALPRVGTTASSETAWEAANAIDAIIRTRWRPVGTEDEWIYVDLGDMYRITRVIVYWAAGIQFAGGYASQDYAARYELQVSDDAENWTTVRSLPDADGGVDDFTGLDVTGRYVRVYVQETSRVPGGVGKCEIWELEAYGEAPAE